MTEENKAKCVEWTKAHAKHWQTYKRAQWKYKWHGKTLVRFLDNVSMRALQDGLILEFLSSSDCMDTLSLYSQEVSREWTPTSAWYEIMATRGPVNGILQVRLYHALRTDVEDGGDGPYVVENGCMWNVSWQFFWHQTSVPPLPASSSGVNYRIANLNRDDEDGTYSYVLERRERVQQDIPEYVSEVDAFKKQSREEHKGVKGDAKKGGKPASVKKGVIVTREVSKNEDCTHDTSNTKTVSNEVKNSITETTVGLRGGSTVTVNRNMRSKANEKGLQPGESVRNELNEDLTWNQTIRSWSKDFNNWLRGVCRRTIFRHTDAETKATGTDPGFEHVESPTENPGTIHEIDVQRTEQGWDVTKTTHVDSPVNESVVEKRFLLDGVVKTTVNRNQLSPAKTSDVGIGGSVRNEKTESGLYDQTIVNSSTEDVGKIGEHCDDNALVHAHGDTSVYASGSRMIPDSFEVEAGPGEVASIRMERTQSGGFRIMRERRMSKESHAVANGGSVGTLVTVESIRNEDEITAEPAGINQEIDVSASRNEFDKLDGSIRRTFHNRQYAKSSTGSFFVNEDVEVSTYNEDVNPSESFKEGQVFDVSASPTGLGSANITKRRRVAISREWDVEVSLEMSYSFTQYFRNVKQSRYKSLVVELQKKINEKVKNWRDEGRPPSRFYVSPRIEANEYGLFDGSVSIEATWSTGSAGQTGAVNELIFEKRIEAWRGDVKTSDQVWVKGRGRELFIQKLNQWTEQDWITTMRGPSFSYSYNEDNCTWSFTFGC